MKTVIWVVQILVGILLGISAFMKMMTPYEDMLAMMPWVEDFSPMMVKAIGAIELIGVIGMVMPSVLRIKPLLAVYAAWGLVLTMLGAVATHIMRGETMEIVAPLVLAALCAFVARGRSNKFVIEAK